MTVRRILSGLLIAAAASVAACAHRAAPPAVRPALAGRWILATSGSKADTGAIANASAANSEMARSPAGRSGDRRGEYGDREGGGYGARSFDPAAMRAAVEAVRHGDARITIAENADSVHLEYADGSYFDLRMDGHKHDDIWRGVGRIRAAAYWSEAGLVLERKFEDTGVTVRQTFARPAGSPRLTVTTEVKGSAARPLTLRREYTLAEAASAARTP